MAIRFDRIPLASAIFSGLCISPFLLNAQAAHVSGVRPSSVERAKPMDAPAPADFGSVNVGSTSSPMSITFTFDSSATVGSVAVVTQGFTGLDFADAGTGTCKAGTYSSGSSCTVDATFTPPVSGVRYGAAVLYDGSGNPIATGYLEGSGIAPQIDFLPGVQDTVLDWTAPNCCYVDENDGMHVENNSTEYVEIPHDGSYLQSTVNLNGRWGSVSIDGAGNYYVTQDQPFVYKETLLSGGGYAESTLASGLSAQNAAVVDGSGNVYISDALGGQVLLETLSNGTYTQSVIYTCGDVGFQSCPSYATVDSSGNVYVSAYDRDSIVMLTPSSGGYTQSTIGSGLTWPSEVVVDGNGNLYITDTLNSRIVKETLTSSGYVQSVISSSGLFWPWTAGMDYYGNVYISDNYHSRVLEEDVSDPPALTFSGSNSSPQVVTILNNGNNTLTFPALSSANNPSISTGFSLDSTASTACPVVSSGASTPATLAPGASCTLTIDVGPGTFTGSLVLTDSNLNAAAPNYTTQTISLNAVAEKASPTVTLTESAASVPAGQPITLTATVAGISGAAVPTGQVTFGTLPSGTVALNSSGAATWTSSSLPAGTYTVTANYSGDSDYSAAASAAVSFGVGRGAVNLAAVSGQSWTGTYGATGNDTLCVAATNAVGSNLAGVTVTFSGTGLTFSPSSAVTGVNGQACSSIAIPPSVGSYVASASATGVPTVPTFNLTVQPAPLTIRVSPNSIPYGTANPDFTVEKAVGLVSGDTIGGTVIVNVEFGATPSSPVGYYPISVLLSGSSGGNYAATVLPRQVHVRRTLLQVFPYDLGVTYGQTPVLPNRYFFKGFVNGDTAAVVSGAPTFATTVTSTTPVGIYRVTSSVGTLSAANYDFVMMENVLEVYKAPLTLTANNITMQQGSAVPPLTYALTGFVNGDAASVVTGAPILTTTATSSSPPGSYPIIVGAGTLAARNYGVVNYGPPATVTILP